MKSRTDLILDVIKGHLQTTITNLVAEWNVANPGMHLEDIAEWDVGYRDILVGLRFYPAVMLIDQKRVLVDSYTVRHSLVIGLAYSSEDVDMLNGHGNAYKDILVDALLTDHTLGGAVIDSNGLEIECDVISSVYAIAAGIDVDVDRGGFL